jgi:bacteriorhodopsin
MGFQRPASDRIFHYITAAITLVAAIAYFTMGANLGFTPIGVEFHRGDHRVRGTYRQIFYVRYIDWLVSIAIFLRRKLIAMLGSSPRHYFS